MASPLAFDIGGANIKAADGRGFALSRPFALWKEPSLLPRMLDEMLAVAPPADSLAVTMTGELADCFATKADGVRSILAAVREIARDRPLRAWSSSGTWLTLDEACAHPLEAAASNWQALATFIARWAPSGAGVLLDIGSTTCDCIPLVDGQPAPAGRTDPDRLVSGELIYTGVRRSPICAVANAVPWRKAMCPLAQELFATTYDVYLTLRDVPEDEDCRQTADGRPATIVYARGRLARAICADAESFSDEDAIAAATAIARAQLARLAIGVQGVLKRMPSPPQIAVISGSGEFLARRLLERLGFAGKIVSLADKMGPDVSAAACAHALAVLARES